MAEKMHLTPREVEQVEAALDAEPTPVPELTAAIRKVRADAETAALLALATKSCRASLNHYPQSEVEYDNWDQHQAALDPMTDE